MAVDATRSIACGGPNSTGLRSGIPGRAGRLFPDAGARVEVQAIAGHVAVLAPEIANRVLSELPGAGLVAGWRIPLCGGRHPGGCGLPAIPAPLVCMRRCTIVDFGRNYGHYLRESI